jgi:mono/diheme cytochrome c family protein
LAKYTDGELAYLIRTGIKKDGNYAPPWMVKLPHLSDYDMEAVISYLRSDANELQASDRPTIPSKLNFLAKMLLKIGAFGPLPYPDGPIAIPDENDKVAYGRYVAVAKYDCFACHSSDFAKCDFGEPEKSVGFFGGGNPISDPDGNIILSANLTMDAETGLGKWTEEQFVRAVKTGIRPNKIANRNPMLPYSMLEDEEVAAIWAYLQTVPVIHNPNDFTEDFD